MRKFVVALLSLALLLPLSAFAADQGDLLQKIEALSRELESLKAQMHEMQKKETVKEERITMVEKKAEAAEGPSWLEIGGDYRFRMDYLSGKTHDALTFDGPQTGETVKNDNLMTNRFGLNLKAKATEDIQVKARLLMYKVFGHETGGPLGAGSLSDAFFADKFNVFDGNIAHTPSDNTLRVDQAYATWSNVFNLPIWFSVGRRPSTGGIPTNLRMNVEKVGNAGVPGLLVDYAFDGGTIGWAPDIEALPGAYAKICYGKGFDSGVRPNNGLQDVKMFGLDLVPYDTDMLHVEINWNHGSNIFAFPEGKTAVFDTPFIRFINGGNPVTVTNTNLGDVDWYGFTVTGKLEKLGPGDLNLFASAAMSDTHPNSNALTALGMNFGLLWDDATGKKDRTGTAFYVGGRYDIKKTGTKLGAEYNHGSKYWLAMVPASDDIWTGKLGTRGDVYEVYIIQELNKKPIAKRGNAFFRLGYQYYNFKYTESNNWVGSPDKIKDLTQAGPIQFFNVLDKAHDVYLTFDVMF